MFELIGLPVWRTAQYRNGRTFTFLAVHQRYSEVGFLVQEPSSTAHAVGWGPEWVRHTGTDPLVSECSQGGGRGSLFCCCCFKPFWGTTDELRASFCAALKGVCMERGVRTIYVRKPHTIIDEVEFLEGGGIRLQPEFDLAQWQRGLNEHRREVLRREESLRDYIRRGGRY